MRKKLFILMMTTLMAFSAFAGCSQKTVEEEVVVEEKTDGNVEILETPVEVVETTSSSKTMRIGVLQGPTAIGASMLMNEVENGIVFGDYEFEMYTSPDEINAKIISGELDAASVPSNVASVLYTKTGGEILTAVVNTLGTLYVVENNNAIETVNDLSGKTIVMAGQGAVPEYLTQFILDKNSITDCTVEFVSSHAEAVAAIAAGEGDCALLPEPFVSVALSQNENTRIALDVAAEWDQYSYEEKEDIVNTLPMGCLVVRKEYVEANQKAFNKFLDEYKYFLELTNEEIDIAAQYVVNYGIVTDLEVAKQAIPNCSIAFVEGSTMLRVMDNFLAVMFDSNPASIGGEIPDENMYYVRAY